MDPFEFSSAVEFPFVHRDTGFIRLGLYLLVSPVPLHRHDHGVVVGLKAEFGLEAVLIADGSDGALRLRVLCGAQGDAVFVLEVGKSSVFAAGS